MGVYDSGWSDLEYITIDMEGLKVAYFGSYNKKALSNAFVNKDYILFSEVKNNKLELNVFKMLNDKPELIKSNFLDVFSDGADFNGNDSGYLENSKNEQQEAKYFLRNYRGILGLRVDEENRLNNSSKCKFFILEEAKFSIVDSYEIPCGVSPNLLYNLHVGSKSSLYGETEGYGNIVERKLSGEEHVLYKFGNTPPYPEKVFGYFYLPNGNALIVFREPIKIEEFKDGKKINEYKADLNPELKGDFNPPIIVLFIASSLLFLLYGYSLPFGNGFGISAIEIKNVKWVVFCYINIGAIIFPRYFPDSGSHHTWESITGYFYHLELSLIAFVVFYGLIMSNYIKLRWSSFIHMFVIILVLMFVSGMLAFGEGMSAFG